MTWCFDDNMDGKLKIEQSTESAYTSRKTSKERVTILQTHFCSRNLHIAFENEGEADLTKKQSYVCPVEESNLGLAATSIQDFNDTLLMEGGATRVATTPTRLSFVWEGSSWIISLLRSRQVDRMLLEPAHTLKHIRTGRPP
jgi:hypothetical protein